MYAAIQIATAVFGAALGYAGIPYSGMPEIAPIGVRMDKAFDIPASAKL